MNEARSIRQILIVEDSPDVLELLSFSFQNHLRCNVAKTSTARQAGQFLKTIRPDLVISDIQMPDGGGTAVARALVEYQPQTPLIFFSASDLPTQISVSGLPFPVIQKPLILDLLKLACEIKLWPMPESVLKNRREDSH